MVEPFVAVGNEELTRPCPESFVCKHCGETHTVETSVAENGTTTLQFYRCGDRSYLYGLNGRIIERFK